MLNIIMNVFFRLCMQSSLVLHEVFILVLERDNDSDMIDLSE